ncbi:MAG: thioredoxin domain-containing protein [Methanomassiliicoccales archaeon]|jgi:thiol-disulfide isomerase/thioredoxin
MIRDVTEALFNDMMKRSEKLIIVEFWSPGCSVCRDVAPAYEEASNDLSNDVIFLRVNTDANSQMAVKYGVTGTPTFTLFCREGKIMDIVGMTSATMLRNSIKDAIKYKVSCKGRKRPGFEIDGYG